MPTDAVFWNRLAEKYSRQPVANPDAFERKIAITKSKIVEKRALADEIRHAGFIDLTEPDVGADAKIAFIVAAKPR